MVIGDRMMNGFLACGNMLLRLEVVSSDADREMAQRLYFAWLIR